MAKIFVRKFKKLRLPINYVKASRARRAQARLQYIVEQEGLCYFCEADIEEKPPKSIQDKYPLTKSDYPKHFFTHPIHLHHCHDTDMTIGSTHAYCNAVLWEYYGE